MSSMFADSSSFNQPLDHWDTSHGTDMSELFMNVKALNSAIGGMECCARCQYVRHALESQELQSAVSDMGRRPGNRHVGYVCLHGGVQSAFGVIEWCGFINMGRMFYLSNMFNQPLDAWNVSKVTTMSYMFGGASKFNQPLNA